MAGNAGLIEVEGDKQHHRKRDQQHHALLGEHGLEQPLAGAPVEVVPQRRDERSRVWTRRWRGELRIVQFTQRERRRLFVALTRARLQVALVTTERAAEVLRARLDG